MTGASLGRKSEDSKRNRTNSRKATAGVSPLGQHLPSLRDFPVVGALIPGTCVPGWCTPSLGDSETAAASIASSRRTAECSPACTTI
ncbi:hypothetical protein [Rhodopirellula sp. P2]|uniref:hypothetical protein n=1 Tax=Rhodopirellula sp. P2 TaxID=2127060 RepID=UPI0023681526|nr:hypothetical protein [Rhodopirellula sp. P2]WDQ15524.1 hypothetical protein PSR62_17995 [Rhodopirellula sp. P2]